MNNYLSSYQSYRNTNGQVDYVNGQNNNGHVVVQGKIRGMPIYYDNAKVFRKTPYPYIVKNARNKSRKKWTRKSFYGGKRKKNNKKTRHTKKLR